MADTHLQQSSPTFGSVHPSLHQNPSGDAARRLSFCFFRFFVCARPARGGAVLLPEGWFAPPDSNARNNRAPTGITDADRCAALRVGRTHLGANSLVKFPLQDFYLPHVGTQPYKDLVVFLYWQRLADDVMVRYSSENVATTTNIEPSFASPPSVNSWPVNRQERVPVENNVGTVLHVFLNSLYAAGSRDPIVHGQFIKPSSLRVGKWEFIPLGAFEPRLVTIVPRPRSESGSRLQLAELLATYRNNTLGAGEGRGSRWNARLGCGRGPQWRANGSECRRALAWPWWSLRRFGELRVHITHSLGRGVQGEVEALSG